MFLANGFSCTGWRSRWHLHSATPSRSRRRYLSISSCINLLPSAAHRGRSKRRRAMPDLSALYRFRFRESERAKKTAVWKTLCESYFQALVGDDKIIADLACGYGEFVNNIKAREKHAIDLNVDARQFLAPGIKFYLGRADDIKDIHSGAIDVVF